MPHPLVALMKLSKRFSVWRFTLRGRRTADGSADNALPRVLQKTVENEGLRVAPVIPLEAHVVESRFN